MEFEKITKIEAAERQLKEAIRLFFEHRDKLAIHTLSGAAHEILKNLCKKRGIESFIKNLAYIKDDKHKEYIKAVNHPKNFLKHADQDPEEKLKFNEGLNELWLFDSIYLYGKITGKTSHEMNIFQAWFMGKHPKFFFDPLKQKLEEFLIYQDVEDYEFWLKQLDNKK